MSKYEFVSSLDRASISDYVRLFGTSFAGDEKLTEKYLEWQYNENPDGRVIGMDAFSGSELVAHYAIIPRSYRFGGSSLSAALSVNTATHPNHQGNGLFVKLAEATYAAAAVRGVRFVVGVANANSVGGFKRRLGFTELGRVRLHLGFRAQVLNDDTLHLDGNRSWFAWRLANPSRTYRRLFHSDGSATLRTYVAGIPFNVCRVDASLLSGESSRGFVDHADSCLPGLTPCFGSAPAFSIRLPLKVQPSPWHVIWRDLDESISSDVRSRLCINGISMDTF